MKKQPQPAEVDKVEVQRLIKLAEQGGLDATEQRRLVPLLKTLLWLEQALVSTRISVAKLKRLLFGHKTERKPKTDSNGGQDGGTGGSDADTTSDGDSDADTPGDSAVDRGVNDVSTQTDSSADSAPPEEPPNQGKATKGHGRRASTDYSGAETVVCSHPRLRPGDRCPACARGRLYDFAQLVRMRFSGQALALVVRYLLQQLRCASCGELFVAPMPQDAGRETYDTALRVNLALAHYHLGLPFKRIEAYQAMLGMPLPDATQWELVESVADSAYPIYEYLKRLGANQARVYQDDTGARLLSLMKENQADPPPKRQGMYTTVLRFEGPASICLYFTGRSHAGENLDAILAHRDPTLEPIQWMSDALAANTPQQHQDKTLDINCLTHGRRQFIDLDESFPIESAQVINAIAEVYQHDDHCKENALDPIQRLAYHQTHSAPVMDELKAWMHQQLDDHCVEPNSRLGGAFDYLLKRWPALTRFLNTAGAPLDNNIAEQALKMIVRLRKNSLFYKNEHGAYVGDVATSAIETCRLNGVNPLSYLTALMENRSAVFADPGAWLPWNYTNNLDTETPPSLGDPPPILGQGDGLGVAVPQ